MVKNLFKKIRAHWYLYLFNSYRDLLPEALLDGALLDKNSNEYNTYISLIDAHIKAINRLRRNGPHVLKEIQKLQLKKIFVAAHKTVWWKNYLHAHDIDFGMGDPLESFKRIPPVTRHILSSSPLHERVTDLEGAEPSDFQANTSGSTTGTPFTVLHDKKRRLYDNVAFYMGAYEYFGFSFSRHASYNFIFQYNLFGQSFSPSSYYFNFFDHASLYNQDKEELTLPELFRRVDRSREYIVPTHATELVKVIKAMTPQQDRMPIALCSVVGHQLEPELRIASEERIGARIISVYSLREFGLVAHSCFLKPDSFHIIGERVIFEILDEEGVELKNGDEGIIHITSLENTRMPLLRYNTGDRGRLSETLCACGNPNSVLDLERRDLDVIILPDGTKKVARAVMRLFAQEPFIYDVIQFQLDQKSLEHVQVKIVVRNETNKNILSAVLEREMRATASLPESMKVEITYLERFPTTGAKHKPFISLKAVTNSTRHS